MNSITADDLEDLLKAKYAAPAWAFLPQVINQTGYTYTTRTADALAMSLYPSRGLHSHGFEIKVNRGDWITELKNPEKAEEIAKYCDFWWLVSTENIIKIEEVPALWGLMVCKGKALKVIKNAPIKESHPVSKKFLAAIFRKSQEIIVPEAKIKQAYDSGRIAGKEENISQHKYQMKEYDNLKQALYKFEKQSGIKINEYNSDDIGEAVQMVLNGEHFRIKKQLEYLLERSKEITKSIENNLLDPKEHREVGK